MTAWEAQIDLEEFTERDIEQEVQILIVTNQNMDPDPAETEKENPVTTTTAMKMARYLRSYLQSNSGSLEQLQCLSVIENKLMKDKLEAKSVKQSKIEKFFAKTTVPHSPPINGFEPAQMKPDLNLSQLDEEFEEINEVDKCFSEPVVPGERKRK